MPRSRLGFVSGAALCALLSCGATTVTRAQQPWSAVADSPTTRTLWGATFGNGLFVAVGEGGAIATSPDGLTWTARTSGTDQWLLAAEWAETLRRFVVVGEAGTILTSPDGIAWTPRASGTTQRLNSVAWGAGVLVAIGENGTALTSADALTWTARSTGDNGWLRGLAFANGTFVASGHDGTILTSSDGGLTWGRRASGTTRHLDAVAFHRGAFLATGTNYVLTRSSDNGLTWRVDESVGDPGITYNALASFNGVLVAAGDQGRVVDDAGHRWRSDPTGIHYRALAAGAERLVAVGTGGGIATAPRDPVAPRETIIEQSGTTYFGDTPTLRAVALHDTPLAYAWSFNGQPIAGATAATLMLPSLTAAQGGTYAVAATFAGGVGDAGIEIMPRANPPALNLADAAFQAPDFFPVVRHVRPLADGRVYVLGGESGNALLPSGARGIVRLAAEGALDPSFHLAANALPDGYIDDCTVDPAGRLVVLIRSYNYPPATYFLARLTLDGAADPSFRPDARLFASGRLPVQLADGRWLAIRQNADASAPSPSARIETWVQRFTADGALDAAFAPFQLPGVGALDETGWATGEAAPLIVSARDEHGRVFLALHIAGAHAYTTADDGSSLLFRLLPDGALDPQFTPRPLEVVYSLTATKAGLVARVGRWSWLRTLPETTTTVTREPLWLREDGTPIFSWRDGAESATTRGTRTDVTGGAPILAPVFAATPEGAAIQLVQGTRGHFGFIRLTPPQAGTAPGQLDRDFAAELGAQTAEIAQAHLLSDGALLVLGRKSTSAGVSWHYLQRLRPNTHAARTHLGNLSVRARAGTGAATLIGGFNVLGDTTILARGIGPALKAFSVAGPLEDPQLGIVAMANPAAPPVTNDDWDVAAPDAIAAAAARLGAFPLAAGSRDAALLTPVSSGAHTLQVTGKNGATGVALAEIYFADTAPVAAASPRLTNLSARAVAGSGADTLIVGFTIAGDNTRNILLRGVGPGLQAYAVADTLADPVLTLYRGGTAIATNDDWSATTGEAAPAVRAAAEATGAFPLAKGAKDAALLVTLTPGSYTVQVAGKSSATAGVALLEIYEVP